MNLRVHDYHLCGYEVRKFGGEIVLHLELDERDQSHIKFSDVEAYNFIHTGGAIIFDIEEISIGRLIADMADQMAKWSREHGGYSRLIDDRDRYRADLESQGYKAWLITSSVGFEGFVIAKSVTEMRE